MTSPLQPMLAQASGADCLSTGLMFLGMLLIFYFLLIRPQIKEQQKLEEIRSALKVEDRVITSGGIYGRIVDIETDRVTIEVAPKTRMKVARQNVMQKDESTPTRTEEPAPGRRKGRKGKDDAKEGDTGSDDD
ncbi:MAG: preprotein translocase subunit YajC [Deltaproteobacteria bacterium]|nr:MAG: preprotein translocase subunit YajC [Deltaproteobacteria bacterium]